MIQKYAVKDPIIATVLFIRCGMLCSSQRVVVDLEIPLSSTKEGLLIIFHLLTFLFDYLLYFIY